MSELSLVQYKDAYAVSIGENMLIYGLTKNEARDFIESYYARIPDGQRTFASKTRSYDRNRPADRQRNQRGRKLILERYIPAIQSYIEKSSCPTIKELDSVLQKAGASYSSTVSIRNVLNRLGHEIPWNISGPDAKAAVNR